MSEQRTAVEELDALIDELVHELDGIQVRRRSIEELALADQAFHRRDAGSRTAVQERIDEKLSAILEARLEQEAEIKFRARLERTTAKLIARRGACT